MTETGSAAEDGTASHGAVPFISRVRIKNYKSIASCDVRLGPLTILVGPNGSGKSNFLDALAFMARALETTPAEAIDERGGLDEILRQVPDRANSFSIAVEASVPWWPARPEAVATYEFEIGHAQDGSGFEVIREKCVVSGGAEEPESEATWHRDDNPGSPVNARLYLRAIGGQRPFGAVYEGLSRPRFYNFNMDMLRRPQPAAARALLRHGGEGLGDVLAALDSPSKARVDAYLSAIVQYATEVGARRVGGYTAIALKYGIDGAEYEFSSLAMSDGTIRAVAVLAALFQPESQDGRLPLVGIEEPETALHPAAAGVLFDALAEASEHVQVIATSQSPDLLDREDLDPSVVRIVAMRDGMTIIGDVDEASKEIARQKLYTLGELMRGDQLVPAPADGDGPEA